MIFRKYFLNSVTGQTDNEHHILKHLKIMYKYPEYIKKYLGYLKMIFIKYVFSLNCSSIDINVN